MNKRILPFLLIIVGIIVYAILSTIFAKGDIEWMDFIKIDGITYDRNYEITLEELKNIELDKAYYKIRGKVPDYVSSFYKVKNGYSSLYEKNTQVYQVKGYSKKFRLAVKVNDQIRLYEASMNPRAKTGQDYLDIKNKVDYIEILSHRDWNTILAIIKNKNDVQKITNTILESPTNSEDVDYGGEQYVIKFHLVDGSSLISHYLIEQRILNNNIKVSEDINTVFAKYLTE